MASSEEASLKVTIVVSLFKGSRGEPHSPRKKINNSLVSIPRRISQRTKCHQNEGKRVTINSSLIPYLRTKVNSFKGGQLSLHIHEWVTLITDATILQTISGECIEFISQPFDQVAYPQNSISRDHMSLVDEEIFALQNNGVIMDTIRTVLGLVTPNCRMASLDLKDAYYSVRIHPYFQKYLKFMYNGESLNTQFFLMVLPLVLEIH